MRNKRILVAILSGILVLGLVVTAVAFWGNGNDNGNAYEPYEPAIADCVPETVIDELCEIELAEVEAIRAAERAEREAYWTAVAQAELARLQAERAETAEIRAAERAAADDENVDAGGNDTTVSTNDNANTNSNTNNTSVEREIEYTGRNEFGGYGVAGGGVGEMPDVIDLGCWDCCVFGG